MVSAGLSGLHDLLAYADLVLSGDLEVYLNAVAEHTPSIADEKNMAHLTGDGQAPTIPVRQDSVGGCRYILRY